MATTNQLTRDAEYLIYRAFRLLKKVSPGDTMEADELTEVRTPILPTQLHPTYPYMSHAPTESAVITPHDDPGSNPPHPPTPPTHRQVLSDLGVKYRARVKAEVIRRTTMSASPRSSATPNTDG